MKLWCQKLVPELIKLIDQIDDFLKSVFFIIKLSHFFKKAICKHTFLYTIRSNKVRE